MIEDLCGWNRKSFRSKLAHFSNDHISDQIKMRRKWLKRRKVCTFSWWIASQQWGSERFTPVFEERWFPSRTNGFWLLPLSQKLLIVLSTQQVTLASKNSNLCCCLPSLISSFSPSLTKSFSQGDLWCSFKTMRPINRGWIGRVYLEQMTRFVDCCAIQITFIFSKDFHFTVNCRHAGTRKLT